MNHSEYINNILNSLLHNKKIEYYNCHNILDKLYTVELCFKYYFYNIGLFKNIDKKYTIPLLTVERNNKSKLFDVFYNKYKELFNIIDSVKIYVNKIKENFYVLQGSSENSEESKFISSFTKYKNKEDMLNSDNTYVRILNKLILAFKRSIKELKNICYLLIKKERKYGL